MTIRDLIIKLMEQGDMDAEVQIKIITRNPESGSLATCKHVPINFVYSTQPSISIEQAAIDSARVEDR